MPEHTKTLTEDDVNYLDTAEMIGPSRWHGVISRARALIAERDRLLAEIAEKESAPQCPHLRELIKESRASAEEAQHANGELDRVEKERDAAVAELARLREGAGETQFGVFSTLDYDIPVPGRFFRDPALLYAYTDGYIAGKGAK